MNLSSHMLFTWVGIVFCLGHSAMFSGMNLAVFSISRLRLEIEVADGNKNADKLLELRKDSNLALTTILWGNVGINVLMTLLSNSVLTGISAFLFSTVLITFLGEIIPQAYFSRNALKIVSRLAPVLTFYQYLLYPVTKPSALMLDWWLGKESIQYFREHSIRAIIKKHMDADEPDIDRIEGLGALNFLAIDDLTMAQEGVDVDPLSIVQLPSSNGQPLFPEYSQSPRDSFLTTIEKSQKKWVIITDEADTPLMVLDADSFIRHALFKNPPPDPARYCRKPIIIENTATKLGKVLPRFRNKPGKEEDDLVEPDIILTWGDSKRIITGTDIFGRLMRGIPSQELSKPV